jgi:predicted alpha/beta-hydrolase family hydrolase
MARWGVLLAPGASADRNQAALVAIDEALTAAGHTCRRMDFPYRRAGRRAPDREPVLVQAVVQEATRFCADAGLDGKHLLLGGRSMGGRMCSLAVAQGLVAARGLILISYPLHPPGRPDRLRSEHFPRLSVPCLFVSGTRDAFASPEELEAATSAIEGPVTPVWIEGKDHGLRKTDEEVAQLVLDWVSSLAKRPRPRRSGPRG